ncbi:Golgi apparatus membrane protein tvp23 [Elasticomyces elasticus]|nr:Golgi apparatus membrane protein tvp23 [Elasticomyces elasticus]KAK4917357.1 Golgi apparatus membrane protein tvp23 [Elasticomyces elasticus]KAK5755091.1 Golgi apparatus membrane protein tvp23 [Elasticomyces elasticus]
MADISAPPPGTLNWRLSVHPITLVTFLSFRISSLLVYLLGLLFTTNFVLIFIITILLLAADFYYLKNIAGRRLVGLRWWNEVNGSTGDSHWVFESAPQPNEPGGKTVNATDKRFFWLALYAQPALWVGLAVVAVVRLHFIWLTLVGAYIPYSLLVWMMGWEANEAIVIALVLTITNTLAFSRCDKFSQASGLLGGGLYSATLARNVGGALVSRLFNRSS